MVRFFMYRIPLIFSLLLVYASTASSDIYKYTDENGVVCYTDAPFGKKTETVLKERPSAESKPLPENQKYGHYVSRAASKYEIEPELIHAVIKTESNGNRMAVSRKGAMGLMQLMPSTANDMNVGNPFSPEENIEGGTRYLKFLLEKFNGDLTLALAAYNAGPKTVEKYGHVPPISETREYVKKIYALYKGKGNYNNAVYSKKEAPALTQAPIYKVVLDDGTILFTNSSFAKTSKIRF